MINPNSFRALSTDGNPGILSRKKWKGVINRSLQGSYIVRITQSTEPGNTAVMQLYCFIWRSQYLWLRKVFAFLKKNFKASINCKSQLFSPEKKKIQHEIYHRPERKIQTLLSKCVEIWPFKKISPFAPWPAWLVPPYPNVEKEKTEQLTDWETKATGCMWAKE